MSVKYDPIIRGAFPVGVRTQELIDTSRERNLPVEFWYPATEEYRGQDLDKKTQDKFRLLSSVRQEAVRDAQLREGCYPLILFSHGYSGHRRQTTHLCCHLASHGYIIASVDHMGNTIMEMVDSFMKTKQGAFVEEMAEIGERSALDRPLDIIFLIDNIISGNTWVQTEAIDAEHIGMIGHSFGGWTTLVVTGRDARICAALPLAPGGGETPQKKDEDGRDSANLLTTIRTFWNRDVPTLYLAAEKDTLLRLPTIFDLYNRTPEPKRLIVLNNADHFHFNDDIERVHEFFRTQFMTMGGNNSETKILANSMLPASELHPSKGAYEYIRGLGLAHMDANLKRKPEAEEFLSSDLKTIFAKRNIDISLY